MHLTRLAFVIALAATSWSISSQQAVALEDPAEGKKIAEQWCANCHLVSSDQEKASADVPTFMTIAGRSDAELEKLKFFLADPHGSPMPNFNLSRKEIEDILAYIKTLR